MPPKLGFKLLGSFDVTTDRQSLPGFDSPRLQSLLSYLLLHRGAPQSRQWLAALLWPGTSERQARTNLRKIILFLRRALPAENAYLICNGSTLEWRQDAPFTLDVAEFEAALAAGAFEKAVTMYAGDLLPGFYDEWVCAEREHLFQTYQETLEHLIRQKEDAGDYAAALGFAQQLLQCDPLREEVHRHIMRLYDLKGDRAAALHAYQQCAALLQRELDVTPSPATRQVYERLLSHRADASQLVPLAGSFPLFGRTAEWARLQETWQQAAHGSPRLVLISGEAGIGKTRLSEELLAWVDRQGLPISTAYCYAAEGASAYAPVTTWLRGRPLAHLASPWRGEVTRLLPDLSQGSVAPGPLTQDWQRQRFHEALVHAMLGPDLALEQPLLLLLEDIQWCDADTLAWLSYLLRYNARAHLLVVGTLRTEALSLDGPLSALLADLRRHNLLVEIGLQPLDPTQTSRLAEAALGQALDAEAAARLYRETEGNPLFIVEFARAGLVQAATAADIHTAGLPPLVLAAVTSRLAQLSAPAQRLMNLAAVIGREFTFDIINRASQQDEETIIEALDELWQHRIIRERGKRAYDFSHDKLRQVAYNRISPARRQHLHQHVAQALAALNAGRPDPVSGQIGWHYQQAGENQAAAEWLWKAGDYSARIGAYIEAVAYLKSALSLLPTDDPRRAELLCRIGAESVIPYGGDQEMEFLRQGFDLAQQIGDQKTMARASLDMAWAMTHRGNNQEAAALAQAALAHAEAAGDQRTKCRAIISLGILAYYRREYAQAMQYLEMGMAIYQEIDPSLVPDIPSAIANILNYEGLVCLDQKDFTAADRHWRRALELCKQSGNRHIQASVTINLAWSEFVQANFAQAEIIQAEAIRLCQEIGDHGGLAVSHNTLGHIALYRGQLDTALVNYRTGLKEAAYFETTPMTLESLAGLAGLWVQTGQALRAAELFGLATSHTHTSPEVAQIAPYVRQLLQEALPPTELETALQRGKALDLDQVVKETLATLMSECAAPG